MGTKVEMIILRHERQADLELGEPIVQFGFGAYMDSNVRQYEIPFPPRKLSWRKKLVWFFITFVYAFAFRWLCEVLFHWKHRPFPEALIFPVIFAALYVFLPRFKWTRSIGSVLLAESFVEGRAHTGWYTMKKRIYRDRIKSITENRYGMCVMDRSEFLARMTRFIFIPATLPEYAEIRYTLAQWHPIKSKTGRSTISL